jgi:hypothetical protein
MSPMPMGLDRRSPRQVTGQRPMEFVAEADVVLIGSAVKTRDVVADDRLLSMLPLDPSRQLIGSRCSRALVLARLGLLDSGSHQRSLRMDVRRRGSRSPSPERVSYRPSGSASTAESPKHVRMRRNLFDRQAELFARIQPDRPTNWHSS